MPFDGFGNFLRLYSWVVDATNSVKIRADRHDAEDNNFTAGLSNCITKDGQSIISQNTPWNSRRITALADPVDPQDAATKAYADTKASLGGATFTSDVVLKETTPSLTLDGTAGTKNSIYGQKSDKNRWEIVLGNAAAEAGSDAGSNFELLNYHDDGTLIGDVLFGIRATGLMTVKGDPTTALGIATKQYTDAKIAAIPVGNYLPLAGGTITGNLTVNNYIAIGGNVLYFSSIGNPAGFIQWQGGNTYVVGGVGAYPQSGGTIWHSGNFRPVGTYSDARLIVAGNYSGLEPVSGGIVTGVSGGLQSIRYLQMYREAPDQRWLTVGYYP